MNSHPNPNSHYYFSQVYTENNVFLSLVYIIFLKRLLSSAGDVKFGMASRPMLREQMLAVQECDAVPCLVSRIRE